MVRTPRSFKGPLGGFSSISADFAAAIGYVSAGWADVEGLLAGTIEGLLNLSPRGGKVMTSELSALAKMNLIAALFHEAHNAEWIELWANLASEVDILRVERNVIIHSSWTSFGEEHQQYYVRTQKRIIKRSERRTPDQLIDLADRITTVCERFVWDIAPVLKAASEDLSAFKSKNSPLIPGQSRGALAQAQARETKRLQKEADRARSSNRPKVSKPLEE